MATHRYISTTFWDDAWIQELDPSEKFVYLYLMTNPLTSISGVYKITDRRISFDTGYNADTVKNIMAKFSAALKAIRYGEWVILPTWPKHQSLDKNENLMKGVIRELQGLPEDVFQKIKEVGYRFDLDSIRKSKPKENNDTPEALPPSSGSADTTKPEGSPSQAPLSPYLPPSSGSVQPPIIQSYSDSIPSEFNNNLGGNSMSKPNPENKGGCENPGENSPPPPNLLQIIKDKAKAQSFYLDDPVVRKISKAIPNWQWFTDQHSIIDFVTRKIMDIYRDKPKAEHKKLFISALTSWDNIKDEYPDWLATQINADEIAALELLRKTPPTHCLSCGTELEKDTCPKCKGSVFFSEEKKAWEYQEYFDFSAKLAEMRQGLGKEQKPEGEPEKSKEDNPDDIDF